MSAVTQPPTPSNAALGGHIPDIAATAWIAPGAMVIGRVTLGARSSVWYGSVLRGDDEGIRIGVDCNVQDGCIIHADVDEPAVLGDRVSLGHGAIVHAATVEHDSLVGIRAVVLNGAHIGTGSVIAAGAVVRPGIEVPPGSLVVGVPGEVRRPAGAAERAVIEDTAAEYVRKAARHCEGLTWR